MKSKYRNKQIANLSKDIEESIEPSSLTETSLATKLYLLGWRKNSLFFLTVHILLGTWHIFFYVPLMFFMIGLVFIREEMAANPAFIIWQMIPVLIMSAEIISSYRDAIKMTRND